MPFLLLLLFFLIGCSQPLKKSEDSSSVQLLEEFQALCQRLSAKKITGTLWMDFRTNDLKGQFPANVEIQAPQDVSMIVTNPLGGVEAEIRVQGSHFEVVFRDKKMNLKGEKMWAGIPLEFAVELLNRGLVCLRGEISAIEKSKNEVIWEDSSAKVELRFDSEIRELKNLLGEKVTFKGPQTPKGLNQVEILYKQWTGKRLYPKRVTIKTDMGEVRLSWRTRKDEI